MHVILLDSLLCPAPLLPFPVVPPLIVPGRISNTALDGSFSQNMITKLFAALHLGTRRAFRRKFVQGVVHPKACRPSIGGEFRDINNIVNREFLVVIFHDRHRSVENFFRRNRPEEISRNLLSVVGENLDRAVKRHADVLDILKNKLSEVVLCRDAAIVLNPVGRVLNAC
jgi:hypothetical protein